MIITVTPSPSIDWTVEVDSFAFEAVNRVVAKTREASGKGINVSIALRRNGIATTAVLPAGKDTGRFLINELNAAQVQHLAVESSVDVRTNITLIVPGHSGTKINEPGEELADSVLAELMETCRQVLAEAMAGRTSAPVMLAVCGSLPPGTSPDFHPGLIRLGRDAGVSTIVDASGTVLRRAIDEGPDLIKPNVSELAEEAGSSIETLGDVEAAAERIRARGPAAVLASLGSDGMMLVDRHGAIHGRARNLSVVNTVGAGDAALAGFLAGRSEGSDRAACLRSALIYASSAVQYPTTLFEVDPRIAEHVSVTAAFDRSERLVQPARAAGMEPEPLPAAAGDDDPGATRTPDPAQEVHLKT